MKPHMAYMFCHRALSRWGHVISFCDLSIANAFANSTCGLDDLSLMHNMHCIRSCAQGLPVLQAPPALQQHRKTTEADTDFTQADADEPQRKKKTSPCHAAAG